MSQDKNTEKRHFSERCSALAEKLKLNATELAKFIGISRPMLYAYQDLGPSGKPISHKAWRKLQSAEIKAGVGRIPESLYRRRDEALITIAEEGPGDAAFRSQRSVARRLAELVQYRFPGDPIRQSIEYDQIYSQLFEEAIERAIESYERRKSDNKKK